MCSPPFPERYGAEKGHRVCRGSPAARSRPAEASGGPLCGEESTGANFGELWYLQISQVVGGFKHFLFSIIWDNPSNWLIFFRGVETTNQSIIYHRFFISSMKKLRVPWRQVDLGEPPVSDPKRLRLTSVRPQFPRPHIPSNNYRVIQETRGFGGKPEVFCKSW
jgi:hypothetical protein